jgi:hypothetical protein
MNYRPHNLMEIGERVRPLVNHLQIQGGMFEILLAITLCGREDAVQEELHLQVVRSEKVRAKDSRQHESELAIVRQRPKPDA